MILLFELWNGKNSGQMTAMCLEKLQVQLIFFDWFLYFWCIIVFRLSFKFLSFVFFQLIHHNSSSFFLSCFFFFNHFNNGIVAANAFQNKNEKGLWSDRSSFEYTSKWSWLNAPNSGRVAMRTSIFFLWAGVADGWKNNKQRHS